MNAAQWLELFTQVNQDSADDETSAVAFTEENIEYYAEQMFIIEEETGDMDTYMALAREMVSLANQ